MWTAGWVMTAFWQLIPLIPILWNGCLSNRFWSTSKVQKSCNYEPTLFSENKCMLGFVTSFTRNPFLERCKNSKYWSFVFSTMFSIPFLFSSRYTLQSGSSPHMKCNNVIWIVSSVTPNSLMFFFSFLLCLCSCFPSYVSHFSLLLPVHFHIVCTALWS